MQGQHHLGSDDDRVNPHVRSCRVRALALDPDNEVILTGHDPSRARRDCAGGQPRHVMSTVDGIHRETIKQAISNHRFGATAVFFGGLENEAYRPVEITSCGQ
ncbi:hypothetical protein D3C84_578400 [compost metagenome]